MGGRFSGRAREYAAWLADLCGALPSFEGERCFPGQGGIGRAS